MSAVDTFQSFIVTGFDAVFNDDIHLFRELTEICQFLFINTVRPGTDHQSGNTGKIQRLLIGLFQFGKWGIGVGIGLEIGQEFIRPAIPEGME
jgi:hypothetical protein